MFSLAQLGQVMYMNAVYFHNGHIARGETPAKLDYGCINLVYYAYASVAPDGIVHVGAKLVGIFFHCPQVTHFVRECTDTYC